MGHLQSYRQVVKQMSENPHTQSSGLINCLWFRKVTEDTADVPLGWKGSSGTKGKAAFNKRGFLGGELQSNLGTLADDPVKSKIGQTNLFPRWVSFEPSIQKRDNFEATSRQMRQLLGQSRMTGLINQKYSFLGSLWGLNQRECQVGLFSGYCCKV